MPVQKETHTRNNCGSGNWGGSVVETVKQISVHFKPKQLCYVMSAALNSLFSF